MSAFATLVEHGAHLVLCRGKEPIWDKWQRNRPVLEVVEHHAGQGGQIGIVPASVGSSALDIDHGDPAELFGEYPPRLVVPSRKQGHHHGYYDDDQGRRNLSWAALGCRGQVRSGRGYLILYRDAPERLATALTRPGRYPFPDSLFEAAGVPLPIHHAPVEQGPAIAAKRPRQLPMLETVYEGERNDSLFSVTRWWAYSQDRGTSLQRWYDAVRGYALLQNERFPDPLPPQEAGAIAYKVASWTWCGHGAFDHSPAAQRRRGVKLGRMRRAATAERDAAIMADRIEGMTERQIAARHGLTQQGVHYVLHRDAPLLVARS